LKHVEGEKKVENAMLRRRPFETYFGCRYPAYTYDILGTRWD